MMDLIDLADLSKPPGMPALDIMMGAVHAITAGICLEQNTHNSGVGLKVTGDSDGTFFVMWPTITEQHRRTHYDLQYATERGACGIALLLAKKLKNYPAIQQSRKGSGFDYYVGFDPDNLFQDSARLEVSGILNGTDTEVRTRVKQKLAQTDQSDHKIPIPAIVCVVEYSQPQAVFKTK